MVIDPFNLEKTIIIDKPIADSMAAIVIIKIDVNCPKLLLWKKDPYNNEMIIERSIISKHSKIIIMLDLLIDIPNILKINKDKGNK